MSAGPPISEIGALVGDPGRANMLSTLLDGRALTASELAWSTGVAAATASEHLAKLVPAACSMSHGKVATDTSGSPSPRSRVCWKA